MRLNRREMLSLGAGAATLGLLRSAGAAPSGPALESMTADVKPVGHDEYLLRIEKARRLMARHDIGALLIEPGASLVYFTGVQWWRSERLTAAILPRDGDLAVVTPHFEEPSVRESLAVPAEVRVWNEHDDPLATVAGLLRDRKVTAPVGIEETVRFFAVDGLRKVMPRVEIVAGAPVVRGCRMVKSPAELALMRKASDITLAAYARVWPRIEALRPKSYYLDLRRYRRYMDDLAQTPFTPAVSVYFALDAACSEFLADGHAARFAMYAQRNRQLRAGLVALGMTPFTQTGAESHSIVTCKLPKGIAFDALSPDVMELVVDKFVLELNQQLAEREVTLALSPAARAYLAEKGYDKDNGARPLARVIQDEVKRPLTEELLFGALEHGGHVLVKHGEDGLSFDVRGKPQSRKLLPACPPKFRFFKKAVRLPLAVSLQKQRKSRALALRTRV